MIKKCEIISRNPFLNILVVDFDGTNIQMTGNVNKKDKTIYVKYENGIASISSFEEYEQSKRAKQPNTSNKVVKPCAEKED